MNFCANFFYTMLVFIDYGGILPPSTCKMNYVNMQHDYVNMQLIYVILYVNMQDNKFDIEHKLSCMLTLLPRMLT